MKVPPTLSGEKRQLLHELLRGDAARHRRPGEAVEPRQPGDPVPLSAEQSHVWLHTSMAPGVPLYNEAITIHRTGEFDLKTLERSLNEILRRHEIWRTSFDLGSDQPRAVIHRSLRLRLRLVDLMHLPEGERTAEDLRIATAQVRQPFDLERGPLLRAVVTRLASDRHRLHLALHHLIFDGVSLYRVMMPELAVLYAAYRRGEPPILPAPALQYGDYALWRQRRLATDPMSRELEYWRHKLAGELPELRLPADRPSIGLTSHRGSMETFDLPSSMTAALKALSSQARVTLYTTLLATFKVLLHRYSGQDDIVVGGVTDMRHRPELENLIGYFLNGVALRTQPTGAKTFRDYLAEVQATVVEALDASAVPFDRVVREVRPRRDGGRHPLFQVLFSIQPPAPADVNGWSLSQMDVTVGTAKFDLYLELEEQADRILGRFLYSTDLFDAATIRRMIGHWQTLLHGVIEDPDCTLGHLPVLSAGERRELLVDRNATAHDYPQATLHALIAAQARRTPEAIAVECDGRSWSYSELEQEVSRMSRCLQHAGVGTETLVAIAMERSLEMVAGLLAILEAGGAYLPIDPSLPPARLAFFLEDARPSIVLTQESVLGHLPRSDAGVVIYEDATDQEMRPDKLPPTAVGPDNLAYVLYTSGSTAKPKAVEITHRALVNLLGAMQRDLAFDAGDSFLAVTTLSFDIAALELFLPLLAGGRLVVASREDAADPWRLLQLLSRSHCTTMQATPATWRGLIGAGWSGERRLKILCGGEALPTDLAAALLDRGSALSNMYGPTETTIWSLRHEVGPGDDPVPIGRPLSNTRVYVLDSNGTPVPDGVAGELYIGGDGLARGYRNDPALTAERFVSCPFLADERLYRTGDTVRYRRGGVVEFLGRVDNQVKIRGFRVGLEEVESAIAQHPEIAAAAVQGVRDASGELSLVAYVVGDGIQDRELSGLRKFLRQSLPGYMVPTHFIVLPELPMTPNGKVDRKRLPEPQSVEPVDRTEPRNEIERRLAGIWKDLLGLSNVGIHDDFFDLGGHSLLAYMLLSQSRTAWGCELPLAALFRSPTIASLAEALQSASEQRFSHLVELRTGNAGRPLFIVHGVFGDVMQLKALAEQMETSRPVYALQARGADPRQEPHSTIAEMAEAYLDAIRGVQVAGPYALAGYSFGGLIAFEMARRLRERGEEVELLALLETDLHERYLPLPHWLAYQWSLALRVMGKAVSMPIETLPMYLASKLVQLCNKLRTRANLRDPAGELEGTVWALSERHRRMFQIGVREFVSFRPGRYDRTASLFRVTGPRFGVCDPLPIWRRAVRSLEVYAIAGEHDTIMEEPFVRTLALELSRCLAAAERTATVPPAVERPSKPRWGPSSSPLVLLDDHLEAVPHGGES